MKQYKIGDVFISSSFGASGKRLVVAWFVRDISGRYIYPWIIYTNHPVWTMKANKNKNTHVQKGGWLMDNAVHLEYKG